MVFNLEQNLGQNFDGINSYIAGKNSNRTYKSGSAFNVQTATNVKPQPTVEPQPATADVQTALETTEETTDLQKRVATLALMVTGLAEKAQIHQMKLKTSSLMLISLLNRPREATFVTEPVIIETVIQTIIEKPINIKDSLDSILNECSDDHQRQKICNALLNGLHPDRTGTQNENQKILVAHLINLRNQFKAV
jgi:molecular chaperone GrpE (heat shock protein)